MKDRFIAKKYWKDHGTAMGSADVLARSFDDVINFSLGDPDLITPEVIIEKAFEDAKAGHTKYTEFRGDRELRTEIRKFYKEDYNMDYEDEEVFVSASGCLAMYVVMQAILDDGDEVILSAPYFTPYKAQVEAAGGIPVEMATYEEEDFQINMERLESLITERTKALIINSPANPTGSCLTLETMQKLAEIAEKYDLVIVADEIYTVLSFQHEFIPFASLPGMRERTITINSFSKNYLMTGWRVGMILAPANIIKVISQINGNVIFTTPSISQRAALHGLRMRKEIHPKLVEVFRERMFYGAERINKIPNMHVPYPPKGSFYLFVNIKDTGLTSAEVADKMLREAHVLTLPGSGFGTCGEGYLRLACTVGVDKMKEAFDRIEKMEIFQERK